MEGGDVRHVAYGERLSEPYKVVLSHASLSVADHIYEACDRGDLGRKAIDGFAVRAMFLD